MATETKAMKDSRIRDLVLIDAGNRWIKWIDRVGNTRLIPALIHELEDYEEATPTDQSIVVEVRDRRFIVGRSATGKPVFMGEKASLTSLILLAILEPGDDTGVVSIDNLRILCTDSQQGIYKNMAQHIKEIGFLPDDRRFTRNGREMSLGFIRKVDLVDEGRPVWNYARKNGLWSVPDRLNGVIDVGGGDTTARLFDPLGTIQRQFDLKLPGTKQLASLICSALSREFQYSVGAPEVMDAIANGTFTIEVGLHEFNFRKVFDRQQQRWFGEIYTALKEKWNDMLLSGKVGEVLIAGGSAPLLVWGSDRSTNFEIATSNRFRMVRHEAIPNLSQVINLYGMM